MAKMGMISAALFLWAADGAQASVHSTKWTLRNEARDAMSLSCRNTSVDQIEIILPERTIAGGAEIVHDWGDRFYNDGLWLNPGKWTCSMKTARASRTESFTTEWGEAITLVLSRFDGQLRLKKIPMKAPLATREESDSRTKGSK